MKNVKAGRIFGQKRKELLISGAFFLILLAVHFFMRTNFGDDVHYATEWGKEPLSVFLKERYDWWSSRVVIEAFMLPLTAAPAWVWKFLNILMVLTLVLNSADLFAVERKTQAQLLFFVGIWMIPLLTINGAGWITTTTNYLWTLSLGLVVLRPLKHWLCQEKCAKWEYVICPLCTLYAANMEQMGAILCGAYLVCGMYLFIRKRKVSPLYLVQVLLILGMLYYVLSSPGNGWRKQYEVERYFPEFNFLSTWKKLFIGFLDTGQYYLAGGLRHGCFIFALLSGVLFAAVLQRNLKDREAAKGKKFAEWCKLLVALAPAAFYWGVGHLGSYLLSRDAFPRGGHIVGVLSENRNMSLFGEYPAELVALQAATYLILLLCTALAVYFIHGKSKETLLEWIVLAAGIISRVIIGLSPTIYVSGERTAIFCSVAFLIVAFRNIQMFWIKTADWRGKSAISVYMAVILIGNLYCNKPYLL